MIQDIAPHIFDNQYKIKEADAHSIILCYQDREILIKDTVQDGCYLTYEEYQNRFGKKDETVRYLFSIDDTDFFLGNLCKEETKDAADLTWCRLDSLRGFNAKMLRFAGATGHQLYDWYRNRVFCPRCGQKMIHDQKERMMKCPACKNMEYPKISPAVIVGVTKGDQILLTKYAGRDYTRYALIAGFAEVGETIEETVSREVMEEVGLKVKNFRYYKSQPWSFSSTLLMGFFAELDGDDKIRLDENELSEGVWCDRKDVPEDDGISLTREMMRVFREGKA